MVDTYPTDQMRTLIKDFLTAKWVIANTGGVAPSMIEDESESPVNLVKTDHNVTLTIEIETEVSVSVSGNSSSALKTTVVQFSIKVEGTASLLSTFTKEAERLLLFESIIKYLDDNAITHTFKAIWIDFLGSEQPEHNGIRYDKAIKNYYVMNFMETRSA